MTVPPRVYLDTMVFIAAYESPGARSDHAWLLLQAAERGEIAAVTSELTLAEVLVKPLAMGDHQLVEAYQAVLSSDEALEVTPIDRKILIEAATQRSRRISTKLPDAIHLAAAVRSGCGFFVTRDRDLSVKDGLRLIEFGPFSLNDIEAAAP